MSATEKERFSRAVEKPVRDLHLEPFSRLKGGRVYRGLYVRITRLLFERDADTFGRVVDLDHFHPDRVAYHPSWWRPMRWALRRLRPGRNDVLVDFGSGKGRVVCQAARYPFARVVGCEISSRLTQVAHTNVERNRRRFRCQHIELVTADAADWPVPDDMTIAYLYHPFVGATFGRVLDNILESIERHPRRVRLVYLCPALEDDILASGRFRCVEKRTHRGRPALLYTVSVYEHDPAAG